VLIEALWSQITTSGNGATRKSWGSQHWSRPKVYQRPQYCQFRSFEIL